MNKKKEKSGPAKKKEEKYAKPNLVKTASYRSPRETADALPESARSLARGAPSLGEAALAGPARPG